jgi:hypothetical protein
MLARIKHSGQIEDFIPNVAENLIASGMAEPWPPQKDNKESTACQKVEVASHPQSDVEVAALPGAPKNTSGPRARARS